MLVHLRDKLRAEKILQDKLLAKDNIKVMCDHTLDEVLGERAKQFKKFDKNADGVLDLAEYKALWVEAMNERMVKGFQRHDSDGDGKISEQDFSKKITHMMMWMDKNGDCKVDRDDFHRSHKDD